jgi:predicted nucleic acid-binding protein
LGSAKILSVVDSGPLYAAVDRREPLHQLCRDTLERSDLRPVVPTLVIAEVSYLIEQKLGAVAAARFLGVLGELEVEQPYPEDWARIGELTERYGNIGLGGTDASVVALAERLETPAIITLDHRHFATVRPRHCEAFELLPEL